MPDDLEEVTYRTPGEPRDWETMRADAIRAVQTVLGSGIESDGELAETVTDIVLAIFDDEALNRLGEHLVNESRLRSMDFRNGVNLEMASAREAAAGWVAAARTLLSDAPNYSETSMEFGIPEDPQRYAFTVQKIGKRTPHEMRRQAEAERDEFDAVLRKVRDKHQGDGAESPFCTECGHAWPCWTARAVNGGLDA